MSYIPISDQAIYAILKQNILKQSTFRITAGLISALFLFVQPTSAKAAPTNDLTVNFNQEVRTIKPLIGFLGFLKRDQIPASLIQELNPAAWRIGWQFPGGRPSGLNATIDKVQAYGAQYKLCIGDLLNYKTTNYTRYEADVKALVQAVGLTRAKNIIWEPVNEPDNIGAITTPGAAKGSAASIARFYEIYKHSFKALREMDPTLQIAGPGFSGATYANYTAFLEYCKANHLEVNVLTWHNAGWYPNYPITKNKGVERYGEFKANYPAQQIKEIHCDEWGGSPWEVIGNTNNASQRPGLAVIYFHYLENVYQLDRAGRANWTRSTNTLDDYLGNIISTNYVPLPVYHVYRYYGQTKNQKRVVSDGNYKSLAVLASKGVNGAGQKTAELLLGSTEGTTRTVRLTLTNFPMANYDLKVQVLRGTNLGVELLAIDIPVLNPSAYTISNSAGNVIVTLDNVKAQEAYHFVFTEQVNHR
ncbi:MAG: hypothetical protein WCO56_28870 [Verrucomicrobiota bacterium]